MQNLVLFLTCNTDPVVLLMNILRPTFFNHLFFGTIFLKIGSGGPKKNKNKSMFIPESMKKIKIKVIFIVISFIIFFEELEDS